MTTDTFMGITLLHQTFYAGRLRLPGRSVSRRKHDRLPGMGTQLNQTPRAWPDPILFCSNSRSASARIVSPNRVPANQEQFKEHADAVGGDVHLGGRIVRPAHRHLGDAQAVALGQKQDFRVKTESLDALLLKND